MGSSGAYKIPEGLDWVKNRLATLRASVSEVRSLAQGAAGAAQKALRQSSARQIYDWNDATEVGFYYGVSAVNGPVAVDGGSGSWMMGIVTRHSGDAGDPRYLQEVREARTSVYAVAYRRYWNGLTWSRWVSSGYDTGWVSAKFTVDGGSGFALSSESKSRRIDDMVHHYLQLSRTGATVTADSKGNIGDIFLGTFTAGWEPSIPRIVIPFTVAGVTGGDARATANGIALETMMPTSTITSAQNVYLTAQYLR